MISKMFVVLLAMAMAVALAQPLERDLPEEFYNDYYCTEDITDCPQKAKTCFEYMHANTEEERRAHEKQWQETTEMCKRKEGVTYSEKDQPKPEELKRVVACSLEVLGITTNGKLNRDFIKQELKSFTANASTSVQEAILNAVDTCPHPEDIPQYEVYHKCLMKACLVAM